MKKKSKKKMLRQAKLITIICAVILLIEIAFILYSVFFRNKESLYFDGINAVISDNSSYVTVGSNNDNGINTTKMYEFGKYIGELKNDKRDGKGIMYYNEGNKFEGYFQNRHTVGTGDVFVQPLAACDYVAGIKLPDRSRADNKNLRSKYIHVFLSFRGGDCAGFADYYRAFGRREKNRRGVPQGLSLVLLCAGDCGRNLRNRRDFQVSADGDFHRGRGGYNDGREYTFD